MAAVETSSVEGRVESIADGVVTGWAWSPERPEERLRIVIRCDGNEVATGVADHPAAGDVGDGRHGFSIALPAELADGRQHELAVEGAGESIGLLPKAERSAGGLWAATSFSAPEASGARIAVVGRRDWLFGLGQEHHARLRGAEESVESASFDGLVSALELTAQQLNDLHIRYVVAVLPTKLAVHRELAAPSVRRSHARPPPAATLVQLARDRDYVDVLDLLPALRDAVSHGPLFHPRDDGLNARGAFFAHRALLKCAGLSREGLMPLSLERAVLVRSRAKPPNSLEQLPIFELVEGELVARPPRQLARQILEDVDATTLRSVRMPAPAHLEIEGLPAPRVYEREDAAGTPRAMLLGHPVVHALTPWIAETTSRLVVLSTPSAPLEQIELELPDVVFHVLDERLLTERGGRDVAAA